MTKIISVVGARPNFMKVAPLHKVFLSMKNTLSGSEVPNDVSGINKNHVSNIQHLICHTGQHYDEKMSKVFFDELELPKPDFYLGVGSGSHAEQTGRVMIEFEKILLAENPDVVLVVGDVNSTIACSITAAKLGIKVAHVEAGLRSFDRTMPEEINRILTDSISDYLFVTEKSGLVNLKNEGVPEDKIFFVGNVMIDSLINYLPKIRSNGSEKIFNLDPKNYILVTIHRPSNVDDIENLKITIDLLNKISKIKPVLFPIHPRTANRIKEFDLESQINSNVKIIDPVGYLEFIALMKNAFAVITDSGGIQEETTYLKVPCITLRHNTERPITIEEGTNYLVGNDLQKTYNLVYGFQKGDMKESKIPDLWDGKASERIVNTLISKLN